VLAPLPLFLLGTDHHRWLGFVDWNLTLVVLLLLARATRDGRAIGASIALQPVVVAAFLLQLCAAAAATRLGLAV
jgi:hypothetical protein